MLVCIPIYKVPTISFTRFDDYYTSIWIWEWGGCQISNPLGSTNPPSKKKKHDINTIKFCGCQIRILLLKILSFVSFFFLFFLYFSSALDGFVIWFCDEKMILFYLFLWVLNFMVHEQNKFHKKSHIRTPTIADIILQNFARL